MAGVPLQEFSWERMIGAVEAVRERACRAAAALRQAGGRLGAEVLSRIKQGIALGVDQDRESSPADPLGADAVAQLAQGDEDAGPDQRPHRVIHLHGRSLRVTDDAADAALGPHGLAVAVG